MTRQELYQILQESFERMIIENHLEREKVEISCRALTPEEAIGNTKRRDFPILTGKDVMVQAEYRGGCGQAFTDAPAAFEGTLLDIMRMDIAEDAHARGIFIASLNAVMNALGLCSGTVHCRREGPELCAADMKQYLALQYPDAKRIGLVGYQPALLQMLSESSCEVRVLDLNPENIGTVRYGVTVEDGAAAKEAVIAWADLLLCTGSTLCNGTIVDYLGLDKKVLFFGISAAGCAKLLGLERVCFADQYQA